MKEHKKNLKEGMFQKAKINEIDDLEKGKIS